MMLKKKNVKTRQVVADIIQRVNHTTNSQILAFRNDPFDNILVKLLSSGHRESVEFLENIAKRDRTEFGDSLRRDHEKLKVLSHFLTEAEDFGRNGRYNWVSKSYKKIDKKLESDFVVN